MERLYELKGKIQKIYAGYSKVIDKGVQFLLALVTFLMINKALGNTSMLASPFIAFGMAVICAFLPPIIMVMVAAALLLAHVYTVSLGLLIVAGIAFVLMYAFYVRFAPKTALVIMLTVLAFLLKIPYIVPVACGLLLTPVSAVSVSFGTITYHIITYAAKAAAKAGKDASFMTDINRGAKGIFLNEELWITGMAFIICILVVYNVKRMSIEHPWKIAIAAGAVVDFAFIAAGDAVLGVKASYGMLFLGGVLAVIVGLCIEILFFNVDYTKSETLQYEDDDYYYYVKAVPKVSVAVKGKRARRITAREELGDETQIIDDEENRRRNAKARRTGSNDRQRANQRANARQRAPRAKESNISQNTEHLLLTQSLEKELNMMDRE